MNYQKDDASKQSLDEIRQIDSPIADKLNQLLINLAEAELD